MIKFLTFLLLICSSNGQLFGGGHGGGGGADGILSGIFGSGKQESGSDLLSGQNGAKESGGFLSVITAPIQKIVSGDFLGSINPLRASRGAAASQDGGDLLSSGSDSVQGGDGGGGGGLLSMITSPLQRGGDLFSSITQGGGEGLTGMITSPLQNIPLFGSCDRIAYRGIMNCMENYLPLLRKLTDQKELCCTYYESNACVLALYDTLRQPFEMKGCPKQNLSRKIRRLESSMISSKIKSRCKDFDIGVCQVKSGGDQIDDGFVDEPPPESDINVDPRKETEEKPDLEANNKPKPSITDTVIPLNA